jgi:hypothetical protein
MVDYASTRGRRLADTPASDTGTEQLATARQLKFIQAISREAGLSEDETAEDILRLYGCALSDLTQRNASAYIARLRARRAGTAFE